MTAPVTEAFRSEMDSLWSGPGKPSRAGWDIANRTRNALYRRGIHTAGALTAMTEADLLGIRSFGAVCLGEVKRVLKAHGLSLAEEGGGRG